MEKLCAADYQSPKKASLDRKGLKEQIEAIDNGE